ncbi:unnamed protein product [Schistosoma margrebowiei]|uniref:Uncharacterized protein n=1 Tax=Schistosoma margrebowiei TaxID=48269 RepID=A0A183MEV8_9TREM|nr:unnamed protein product [Schistosoma margrebowiei]
MYNGIGLPTPRGSGTNGYVQKNLAFISNFKEQNPYKTEEDIKRADALLFKEPNKEILEHERKRKIEVKCFEMEQEMEEQGEIEFRVSGFRKKLLDELKASEIKKTPNVEPFEISQSEHGKLLPKGTHENAAVNILKNTIFKEALGIGEQFQDGNSVELAVQRKKDDAETKRLVEAQKEMKTLDSSDDDGEVSSSISSHSKDNLKQQHKKKKKEKKKKKSVKKRKHSLSGDDDNDGGSNDVGELNFTSSSMTYHTNDERSRHKQFHEQEPQQEHKSNKHRSHSKKHKDSHSKERRHHHHH